MSAETLYNIIENIQLQEGDMAILWTHTARTLWPKSEIKRALQEDAEILQEARIFSKSRELHIFQMQGSWKVETVSDENQLDLDILEEIQVIDRSLSAQYVEKIMKVDPDTIRITFNKYISYDLQTGQAYIENLRIKSISNG